MENYTKHYNTSQRHRKEKENHAFKSLSSAIITFHFPNTLASHIVSSLAYEEGFHSLASRSPVHLYLHTHKDILCTHIHTTPAYSCIYPGNFCPLTHHPVSRPALNISGAWGNRNESPQTKCLNI